MFNTSQKNKMVEVLTGPERRRRRTPQEKIDIIQQTMQPGMSVLPLQSRGLSSAIRRQFFCASCSCMALGW